MADGDRDSDDVRGVADAANLSPDDVDELSTELVNALRQMEYKRIGYHTAQLMYDGIISEYGRDTRMHPSIIRFLETSAQLYKFKFAAVPVRTMRDRIELNSIQVDGGGQAKWDQIWDGNNLEIWSEQINFRALRDGVSYVSVWESDNLTEQDDPGIADAGVTITYNDPRFTIVMFDEFDSRLALYSVRAFKIGDQWWVETAYRDYIYSWTTGAEASGCKWILADRIETTTDGREVLIPAVQENPYNTLPVFLVSANDLPYGRPEHEPAYGPQTALSKMLVTQLAVTDAHGWPARWALSDPAAVLDGRGENDTRWMEETGDDESTESDADERAERRAFADGGKPGTIDFFDGIRAVGTFQAADPKAFIDPIEMYMQVMSVVTGTPLYAFKPGGEQPSAAARQIADKPLTSRIKRFHSVAGAAWSDIARFALKISNITATQAKCKWAPASLASSIEDWQVVGAKQASGVPIRETLIDAGIDADMVDRWIKDKQELTATAAGVDLLAKFGQAVSSVGAAVNLGFLDEEIAKQLVADLMAQFEPTGGGTLPRQPDPVMPGDPNASMTATRNEQGIPPSTVERPIRV
jgi:hypothetical protein